MAAGESDATTQRPWTVVILVLLPVTGLVRDILTFDKREPAEIVSTVIGMALVALIAWGLWVGREWARFWTLVIGYMGLLLIAVFILARRDEMPLWFFAIAVPSALITLTLAHHPDTRRYCKSGEPVATSRS